jgi:basic membrane protein A
MNTKKLCLTGLLSCLLTVTFLCVACTKEGDTIYLPNPDEAQPSTAPLVTVIYDVNSLGDRSYNDKIYRGIESAAKKHGFRTLQLVPDSYEQGLAYLETVFRQMESAQDTVRRLFIAPCQGYDEFIRKNNHRLERNPYADLLYLETSTPLEGKGSTLYIDYYGAMYMGGYLCKDYYSSDLDVVLLVLANPHTQWVVEAGEGFVDGFNSTTSAKEKTLKIRYLSNEPGGGFHLADTTALRIYQEAKVNETDDVCVVPICGGAMNAFIRILPKFSYYVGVDDYVFSPMINNYINVIKNIDTVMEYYIDQWADATLPKHRTFGLRDGATDIYASEFTYIRQEKLENLRQEAIRKEEERYEK